MEKMSLKKLFCKVVYNPNKSYDRLQLDNKWHQALRFFIFLTAIIILMCVDNPIQVILLILLIAYRVSYFVVNFYFPHVCK